MKKISALTGQGFSLPKASQKESFLFAGPLRLIFSSVKVTASEESKPYAEVTVSMTSEDSAGCSTKPEVAVTSRSAINGLASAYMGGLRTDNLLNIKAESVFVQAEEKEKGPRPAIRFMQLLTCEEAKALHHNSYLQATDFAECQWASHPLGSMPRRLNSCLASSLNQLLRVVLSASAMASNCSRRLGCIRIWNAGDCPPVLGVRSFSLDIVHTLYSNEIHKVCTLRYVPSLNHSPPKGAVNTKRGLTKPLVGVTVMAERQHTQTRPEFLETYWIFPCYSTTPYGKVSFTRQDRRTFIALFKDSRLIWAGRQPVSNSTQGLKDPKSQVGVKHTMSPKECLKDPVNEKLSLKDWENPTMSAKGTESRSQFNHSPGLLVRKMPHEGIEEISTVPATVSDIATVQGVAHG